MTNFNLGQDVANKREIKWTAALVVAKSLPLYIANCRNGSLRFSY